MATTNPMIGSLTACLLKLTQGDGVDAHQRQNRKTERYECDVEHDRLLADRLPSAERRKISISIRAARHKDFIRPRDDGPPRVPQPTTARLRLN
jgi:hypothetical protein